MTSDELLKIELPSLRDEMLEVKKCQHQMFIFEIVGTGAILGFILPFISTILEKIHFWPVLFLLSPLVIIIPSQYLILDKAITASAAISRSLRSVLDTKNRLISLLGRRGVQNLGEGAES
jgi:hypothetical protein